MKEIRIELGLSPELRVRLNMHSFLNLLNILMGELQLFRLDLDRPDAIPKTMELASHALEAVHTGCLDPELAERVGGLDAIFDAEAREAMEGILEAERGAVEENLANIRSILSVAATRLAEYTGWIDGGLGWQEHSVKELRKSLEGFFSAVEQNSRGRYQIVYNVAAQDPDDYLVNLAVEGDDGDRLMMPPLLHDVFRDLLANARKYTPPGGEITGGLAKSGDELRIVVEDSGIGIPEDEIEQVLTFGYRASNVRDRPTAGAGFGLTKAYAVTRELGGRFFIDSGLGKGTRIRISIPVPDEHRARAP